MSTVPAQSARPWRTEFGACFRLSWPLVLTNATEMGMNITGTATVGRLGPDALAASTLGIALYHVTLLFGIGVTASTAALIARERGRGGDRDDAIRRIAQQGFWGAAAMLPPIWLILWHGDAIYRFTGQSEALTRAATGYLHVLQWAVGPTLVYLVLRSVFTALEEPRWAAATGVGGVLVNALLNVLLVFPHGNWPGLGLRGSALAIVLSNTLMAAALALVALRHPRLRQIRVFARLWRPDLAGWSRYWRLGLPIGMSLVLETGMFAGAAALLGRFGAEALAAHAIAMQVTSFSFMVPLGIAQAATVRVGRAAGAGDRAAVRRAGSVALVFGIGAMLVSASLLIGVPRPIIGLFIGPDEPGAAAVTTLCVTLMLIAGLFQVFDGAQVVLSGMLRGLHEGRVPMMMAAIGYWGVGLPVGAMLGFRAGVGAPGVWLGLTAGLATTSTLLFLRWRWRLGGQKAPGLVAAATAAE